MEASASTWTRVLECMCQPSYHLQPVWNSNVPLGQALDIVAARTFTLEGGNAEPAGLTVVLGSRVASNRVPHDLAAGAGG